MENNNDGKLQGRSEGREYGDSQLTTVPACQGDDDQAFAASVIESALKQMTQAVRIIKNARSVGKKTRTLKGGSPEVQEALNAAAKAVEDKISLLPGLLQKQNSWIIGQEIEVGRI